MPIKEEHQQFIVIIHEHQPKHRAENIVLTFLWTSVRMRYSEARSRLAFRLGRTEELNKSGENLQDEIKTAPLVT